MMAANGYGDFSAILAAKFFGHFAQKLKLDKLKLKPRNQKP